ncbi:Bestrophin-6 [Symbiodinium microadriaticum]|uniref:Bestrophin-6 n=1 Tax=Symbiodinium microadriaticum TaxID=2951 RepID=A0A1Q9F617_SYMMI|nr:Bestrophin-6 [Symbiodinium microadriaticum]
MALQKSPAMGTRSPALTPTLKEDIQQMADALGFGAAQELVPNFEVRRRATEPQPFRVRLRESLFGSSEAFFTLVGWRFLRRSMMGIWQALATYTGISVVFMAVMTCLSDETRCEVDKALHGFALLFDFSRIFLVFTLTAVVGTMYSRWWEMRRLAGTVMGSIQDTSIIVATYIHGEETAELQCDLVRYLNLALILLYIQAREKHGKAPLFSLGQLQELGFVTAEEESVLRTHEGVSSLHSVACMWFLQLWLEAVRDGHVPVEVAAAIHQSVQQNITSLRGAGAAIFTFQNTPPPIGYFRVLYMLLNLSLLIAPFGVYAALESKDVRQWHRWMVVPVVFVIAFFLLSFIRMCYEMFDPFSDGAGSHFPLKHYLESTLRSTFALLEMPREGRLRYYRIAGRSGTVVEVARALEDATSPAQAPCASDFGSPYSLPANRQSAPLEFTGASTMSKESPWCRKRSKTLSVLEAERRLRNQIRSKRFSPVKLLSMLAKDPNERRAVRDLQDGQALFGSTPLGSRGAAWLVNVP